MNSASRSSATPATGGVLFVAWGAVAGRSKEIAEALGGSSRCFFPPHGGTRPHVLLRYAAGALATMALLARTRPKVVIVTNPPIVAALIVWPYCWARRAKLVLDDHPGSFGRQGDRMGTRTLAIHTWLARRATVCLVTAEEWVELVESWGGRAILVHEAPGDWSAAPARPLTGRPRVLWVSRFAGDEPLDVVLQAAEQLPELDFDITGRLSDLPDWARTSAPLNVSFVGFLPAGGYQRLVEQAAVVLALTTEPTSVMRAAYEAVYAGKVLVASDWPLTRKLFPAAVPVANEASAIEEGLRYAVAHHAELSAAATSARSGQIKRWDSQLCELKKHVGMGPPHEQAAG
jgi:glycosyltransferase involved in cell wall biosynthesis